MSWLNETLTGFDLETDSPNPEDARIITACVGTASTDGWTANNWLLQPERDIPEGATAIHGISTEMARIDGADREHSVDQIRDRLMEGWQAGHVLVGHNVVYDLTVLDRELSRLGLGSLSIAGPVIDTLVMDKAVDTYRRGSRRLADVSKHYGLGAIAAHDAEADTRAACRIAWTIARLYPEVGNLPASELTQWCADQYRRQRLSFIEYRRRKGEPLADESTDWPLRPSAQEAAA